MGRVVFRPEANADLAAIALFVAEHSATRAENLVKRLRRRVRILEAHPLAGRPRPDIGEDLRALFERPYVIVYRVLDDDAEVIAVVHAMRDVPAAIAARLHLEGE